MFHHRVRDRKCEVDKTGALRLDISEKWQDTDKQGEYVITWWKEGIQSYFSASEDEYVYTSSLALK